MALILIVIFLTLAVVLRTALQWLRTNDFGLRAARLDAPLIEILPGTFFVLSFASALILLSMGSMGHISPIIKPPYFLELFFFLFGLAGIVITIISQHQMGDSWRIGVDQKEETTLKTNGLYAKSRNPIYFGILLFWIGVSGTFPHPLIWALAAICWCCIEIIVRKIEEPYLKKIHRDMFETYLLNTNRYHPY